MTKQRANQHKSLDIRCNFYDFLFSCFSREHWISWSSNFPRQVSEFLSRKNITDLAVLLVLTSKNIENLENIYVNIIHISAENGQYMTQKSDLMTIQIF